MLQSLNNAQLELLKLFSKPVSKTELKELKKILVAFLSSKLDEEIIAASVKKGYTKEKVNSFLKEHNRRKAHA